MYSFEHFPDHARLWIYAADRILTQSEQELINNKASRFLEQWTAHEIPVDAIFGIQYDCFLLLMVNEETSDISGCGIDKSVAFMKSLGAELHVDFFNRFQIEYRENGAIQICSKSAFEELYQSGTIDEQTITFNKTITRKSDFIQKFEIPVKESWLYPSLKKVTVHL